VPNPDLVQETTTQVNTYTSEYGVASGLQVTMTTKSGSDTFHGLASDYFNYQPMYAKYSLPGSAKSYAPFHSNNLSGTIGGPIIPHHQFFFFFGIEALRSSQSTGNSTITFPDPQFAAWAKANYPTTFGTEILNTYVPSSHVVTNGVVATANHIFPGTCGTAATNFLPCSTQMIDSGTSPASISTSRTTAFTAASSALSRTTAGPMSFRSSRQPTTTGSGLCR